MKETKQQKKGGTSLTGPDEREKIAEKGRNATDRSK
jgi:hypothetical protein